MIDPYDLINREQNYQDIMYNVYSFVLLNIIYMSNQVSTISVRTEIYTKACTSHIYNNKVGLPLSSCVHVSKEGRAIEDTCLLFKTFTLDLFQV